MFDCARARCWLGDRRGDSHGAGCEIWLATTGDIEMSGTRESLKTRVRLFGLFGATGLLVRRLAAVFVEVRTQNVYVSNHHENTICDDPDIGLVCKDDITSAVQRGDIPAEEGRRLTQLIESGCIGCWAEIDGHFAGHAWIQVSNVYHFDKRGTFTIPDNIVVMRNLLVYPSFRGRGLAGRLNAARLAHVPPGHIPIVFIMPENRYAIRNWEKYGFAAVVFVRRICWFKRIMQVRCKALSDLAIVADLIARIG